MFFAISRLSIDTLCFTPCNLKEKIMHVKGHGPDITDEDLDCLKDIINQNNKFLFCLDISILGFNREALVKILNHLALFKTFISINLSDNGIDDSLMDKIIVIAQNNIHIKKLTLDFNNIQDEGAVKLYTLGLKNNHSMHFSLKGNNVRLDTVNFIEYEFQKNTFLFNLAQPNFLYGNTECVLKEAEKKVYQTSVNSIIYLYSRLVAPWVEYDFFPREIFEMIVKEQIKSLPSILGKDKLFTEEEVKIIMKKLEFSTQKGLENVWRKKIDAEIPRPLLWSEFIQNKNQISSHLL